MSFSRRFCQIFLHCWSAQQSPVCTLSEANENASKSPLHPYRTESPDLNVWKYPLGRRTETGFTFQTRKEPSGECTWRRSDEPLSSGMTEPEDLRTTFLIDNSLHLNVGYSFTIKMASRDIVLQAHHRVALSLQNVHESRGSRCGNPGHGLFTYHFLFHSILRKKVNWEQPNILIPVDDNPSTSNHVSALDQ